jgi:hypothetical protein
MEEVEVSEPFETEEEVVFSYAMTYQTGTELSKPKMVGNLFSYTPITGFRLSSDPYPRGIAYMLKDLQIAQVILMSVSLVLTIKTIKDNVLIEGGSLTNESQFMKGRHLLNAPPGKISQEWRLMNPGEQPVKLLHEQANNYNLQVFKQILDDAQKTSTGATDPALGKANASDSGVKLSQMQAAAGQYQKWDDNQYHRFLSSIGTWLKETIPYNRSGKHDIMVTNNEGERVVNEVKGTMFHPELFIVSATIDSGAEAVRQHKIDLAMTLKQMGVISSERLLSDLDVNNPKQVYKEALEEQGIMEAIRILTEDPDLMQYVMEYANKQKAIGRAGSAGKDTEHLQNKKSKTKGNTAK